MRTKLVIDEEVGRPISEVVLKEYELQIGFKLPKSYRDFLLEYNGGHPSPDFIDLPPEDDWPAQFQHFYGLDANSWYADAWTKFKFFDTWIPHGLLMIGALSLDHSELCFDFRKAPGDSIKARARKLLFGSELLDSANEKIPVKLFDWRYFNETRSFREQDLYFVAADFDELLTKFRQLNDYEEAKIAELMSGVDSGEATGSEMGTGDFSTGSESLALEFDRPPKLSILADERLLGKNRRVR